MSKNLLPFSASGRYLDALLVPALLPISLAIGPTKSVNNPRPKPSVMFFFFLRSVESDSSVAISSGMKPNTLGKFCFNIPVRLSPSLVSDTVSINTPAPVLNPKVARRWKPGSAKILALEAPAPRKAVDIPPLASSGTATELISRAACITSFSNLGILGILTPGMLLTV